MTVPDLDDLVDGVLAGRRASVARAITLVESTRDDHRRAARELLRRLPAPATPAARVGISGVPGVGKSTFIEALGTMLTGQGHRVGVLAVDPSSTRTGGSVLGDKTRMSRLAADPAAYVRPSPTSGTLGGVARATQQAMLVLEAAGYDVVLVETVGVGQSEVTVAGMVDTFCFLTLARTGDQLQGIKKGVLELADLIAVNKADGDNRLRAEQAAVHYRRALSILEPVNPAWRPPVQLVSALEEIGLDELWSTIEEHRATLEAEGGLAARRGEQQVRWLWSLLDARIEDRLRQTLGQDLPALEAAVGKGELAPGEAVDRLVARLFPEA